MNYLEYNKARVGCNQGKSKGAMRGIFAVIYYLVGGNSHLTKIPF